MIENIKKKGEILFEKEWGRWSVSLVVTMIFFMLLYMESSIVFFINDDENIMYSLAGNYTYGIPADHSFINAILSLFLQGLYKIFPMISWYGFFHVAMLFLSMVICGKSILKIVHNNEGKFWQGIFLFLTVSLVVYTYPIVLMQFTTTSALSGVAAIVLIICIDMSTDSKLVISLDSVLSVIMILMCYMHRKNSGYILFCFLLLSVIYKIFTSKEKMKNAVIHGLLYTISVMVLVLGVTFISQNVIRNSADWLEFYEYDNARYKMTDYPHDTIYSNPALYENIGWDESLYKIAGSPLWFFMDDRINVETFNIISHTGYYNYDNFDLRLIISRAVDLLRNEIIARGLTTFFVIIWLIASAVAFSRKKWLDVLMLLCTAAGAFLMCFYLCWKGRFILRAFQVVFFPTIIITMIMLVKNINLKYDLQKAIIFASLIAAIAYGFDSFEVIKSLAEDRNVKSQRTLLIEQYAIENPENMYIYDTSLTFRYMPFVTYTESFPSNLMFWGGMGWKSPTYYKQLEMNNIKEMDSSVFLNENTYHISYDNFWVYDGMNMINLLENYLDNVYGNVDITEVDKITDEIKVYSIKRNETGL